MKKDSQEILVKQTVKTITDLNELTSDKVTEIAPVVEPEPQELSLKSRAQMEGVFYVEPKKRLPAVGTLPEKLKADHKRDWEYVKGMYENYVNIGEHVAFWFCKYPGDPDCLWEIPANKPVYIPRMIARHLEEAQKYHTFTHAPRSVERQRKDDHMEDFTVTGTHYRGKFRPIGAFA